MRYLLVLPLVLFLAGCPVTQTQDTPVEEMRRTEPRSGRNYWIYVPSYYESANRPMPLVITLHGTYGYDGKHAQVKEWKALAERHGFIVAAPHMKSVQGILPTVEDWWMEDLREDEQAILLLLDDLLQRYRIAREPLSQGGKPYVLLTGFSAGGFPMYYTGLRNPQKFHCLVARSCNWKEDVVNGLQIKPGGDRLPIVVFWGRDDAFIRDHGWAAFRWLRENGYRGAQKEIIKGGHWRRPDVALQVWKTYLPPRVLRP